MVARLTDGLPVTTEWLNSLVSAITQLESAAATPTTGSTPRTVKYSGGFIGDSGPVQVLCGELVGSATGGLHTFETTINFSTAFANNNVIVVATPAFPSMGARKPRPFMAAASVANITSSKADLTVTLTEDDMNFNAGKQVKVHWIAIGPAK